MKFGWLLLTLCLGKRLAKPDLCVVISPDESNKYLATVTVAAMTSAIKSYPTRINYVFKRKKGQLALDQIKSVDKQRLIKKLGELDDATSKSVCDLLVEIFQY